MKIMIPVDDDRRSVCVSFARAPYWLVHDSDTDATEVLENPAADAEGGAGPMAAQFVLDCEADAVITVRCGENAAKVLQAAEVAIYKNEGSDGMQNLALLLEGKLTKLEHFHAGFHGHQ